MFKTLWIAKTGMEVQQTQMDITANNLANVSTNGFKRARGIFEDLLYQTMRQPGAQTTQQSQLSSGLQVGTGARIVSTLREFTQGNLAQTNDELSVAIDGLGFFQIALSDGSMAYTRDGAFQRDSQGQLVTSSGYVVQPPITIPPTAIKTTIGTDGTVSVTLPQNPTPQQVGTLQLTTFINPAGLAARGEGLYMETQSSGTPITNTPGIDGAGQLQQGFVETSNVNVVEELVNMIQNQRAYEINSKAISTADQMLQRLTQM
ncbi:MAG: flagellar basal-body rod protein FlgG [Proteobacteria bacterium]|nr:flagellar basal-body rod protein FlgG [Pseudomonadota bacterium]